MSRVHSAENSGEPGSGPIGMSEKLAARRAGVSPTTFKNLRRDGKGPLYAAIGRRIIYRPADVDAWLQQQSPERRNAPLPVDAGQS